MYLLRDFAGYHQPINTAGNWNSDCEFDAKGLAALFVTKTLDRIHARGADRRHHAAQDPDKRENDGSHHQTADIYLRMDVAGLQVRRQRRSSKAMLRHPMKSDKQCRFRPPSPQM